MRGEEEEVNSLPITYYPLPITCSPFPVPRLYQGLIKRGDGTVNRGRND